jgi:hypothetical protein
MADGKAPHYLVDLNFDRVPDLCISHEDHKSFHAGNAVAFTGNVLNIDFVLFSDLYWSRSVHGGSACVVTHQNTSPSLEEQSDFMSDGETPHYFVNLDLDLISDLGVGNKDHKF